MNDKNLMWVLAVLLVIPIAFSMMSRESFRYPCQDPANWEAAECNPPICEATGTCTKDIVGNISTTTTETGTSNG